MTTRALHLELAGDMPTDSFILALRRFKARRGHPESIQSDNRSNLIGAQGELKDALSKLDRKKIINELIESQYNGCLIHKKVHGWVEQWKPS